MSELLVERPGVALYHAQHTELAALQGPEPKAMRHVIVDAPYSARTHGGHGNKRAADRLTRRKLNYSHWTADDVELFISTWAPLATGWIVSITDHVLAPAWAAAMESAGRYVFSPLAFVAPGSRVRMGGDGPAQWSCFIVVSRPKKRSFLSWGALPGAYVLPPGFDDRRQGDAGVVGGKPLWLMERLVEDYTRAGDIVIDPCCGAGTTLVAATSLRRQAIGGDAMRGHAELAEDRLSRPTQHDLLASDGACAWGHE